MKYIFAGDIHGSAKYLDMLLAEFARLKGDRLVLLGDLYYHGPRNPLPEGYDPKLCYETLNQMSSKLIAIQGNCDAEVDQMVSEFPLVKETRLELDGLTVTCTHGHASGPQSIPSNAGDVLMYGHYHVTGMEKDEKTGVFLMSPGSVSLPKDGRRAFISYENRVFKLIDLLTGETIRTVEF